MATGYIYVTEKTTTVGAANITVEMGKTAKIEPKINTNNDTRYWIEKEITEVKGENGEKFDISKPMQYEYEPVTYSVDKTAAKFIRVTKDGTIIPLQVTKASGVKVTIKTLSGKTAKVKVVVTAPAPTSTN